MKKRFKVALDMFLEYFSVSKSHHKLTGKQLMVARAIIGNSIAKELSKYTAASYIAISEEDGWKYNSVSDEMVSNKHYETLVITTKFGTFLCEMIDVEQRNKNEQFVAAIREKRSEDDINKRGAIPFEDASSCDHFLFLVEDASQIPRRPTPPTWTDDDQARLEEERKQMNQVYLLNKKWEVYCLENGKKDHKAFLEEIPWVTRIRGKQSAWDEEGYLRWFALLEHNGTKTISYYDAEKEEWVDYSGTGIVQEDIDNHFDEPVHAQDDEGEDEESE